jgi:glycerol uptake facilitator-like aquaporin
MFLTVGAAGIEVVAAMHPGQIGAVPRAVVPALIVSAMIYALGPRSGAHFNAAVTIAFATRTLFPWARLPGYVVAQLCGAVAGAAIIRAVLGATGAQGTTVPHGAVDRSLAMEVLLTTLLALVILAAATEHRLLGPDAAIPTGLTIAATGLIGGTVSGPSMDPARSLGPAIVAGVGNDQWIYAAGPIGGALIAVGITWAIAGPPAHDDEEQDAAEGDESG